jgi:hypothetical protein
MAACGTRSQQPDGDDTGSRAEINGGSYPGHGRLSRACSGADSGPVRQHSQPPPLNRSIADGRPYAGKPPRRTHRRHGMGSAVCDVFATAYKKFLAKYAPPEGQTGTDETPLQALPDAVVKINAPGQLEQDLARLGMDAGFIATGSAQGDKPRPPSAFYSIRPSVTARMHVRLTWASKARLSPSIT